MNGIARFLGSLRHGYGDGRLNKRSLWPKMNEIARFLDSYAKATETEDLLRCRYGNPKAGNDLQKF